MAIEYPLSSSTRRAASLRGDGTNPQPMEFGRLKTARTRGETSLEFKTLTDKPENAYLKQSPMWLRSAAAFRSRLAMK
jgi:hypothetical protein